MKNSRVSPSSNACQKSCETSDPDVNSLTFIIVVLILILLPILGIVKLIILIIFCIFVIVIVVVFFILVIVIFRLIILLLIQMPSPVIIELSLMLRVRFHCRPWIIDQPRLIIRLRTLPQFWIHPVRSVVLALGVAACSVVE
jgi:hypothetical protein